MNIIDERQHKQNQLTFENRVYLTRQFQIAYIGMKELSGDRLALEILEELARRCGVTSPLSFEEREQIR